MSDENDQTMEAPTEVAEESNYSSVDPGGGGSDDNLRNFGGAIAVCALLALFGGSTFAWWNVEFTFFDEKVSLAYGTNEVYSEVGSEDDSTAYDDGDADYDEVGSFFSTLKIMLYALVICGAGLAYMGHSGEKTEFTAKVIAVAGLLSVIILLYVFFSLPSAFNDDTEGVLSGDEDVSYFYSEDGLDATFGLGMLLPLASLGICGYMVKDRGITLKDITG
jgi:hypothetical protein